jgi:maltokinase
VTGPGSADLSEGTREALAELVSSHLDRQAANGSAGQSGGSAGASTGESVTAAVEVVEAEVVVRGRPGIVDVVASVGPRTVHLALGLREPGSEMKFLAGDEDPVLGVFEDGDGLAVAFDAMHDAEVVTTLLKHVADQETDPARVRQIGHTPVSVTLAVEDRLAFTVFSDLVEGPRPGLGLLLALDEVGFNHIAPPVAVWRRGGRDLGIIQEYLAGASSGLDLAVTSVRDLYGSGGPPELAGGDFGAEAHRLGTMAARMHLGLAEAFGRREGDGGAWADALEEAVRPVAPTLLDRPDVGVLIEELRALTVPCFAIRTHGDFHVGRVARTEQGWYVTDFSPGGQPVITAGIVGPDGGAGSGAGPIYRSPLADVADLLWSLGTVASDAAAERDPDGREGLGELAEAWELRNRRAFFAGYLGVAGISGLVPPGREAVRVLVSAFELERVAARLARQGRR